MGKPVMYIMAVIVLSLGLQSVDQVIGGKSGANDLLSGLTKGLSAGICPIKVLAKSPECRDKAGKDWKVDDNQKKTACCFSYDVIDCMRGHVSKECGSDEGKDTDTALRESAEGLYEGECSDYGYRWYHHYKAWKCHIPWLLIAIVAVVTIISIVIVVYFVKK